MDPHYKYFEMDKPQIFWEAHKSVHEPGFFSEEFIDLMTNMLAYDPSARLSIAEIIGHPWMQMGPMATHEQVVADFK